MNWDEAIEKFQRYILLERGYSPKTLTEYSAAVRVFSIFCVKHFSVEPEHVRPEHIRGYITYRSKGTMQYSASRQKMDVAALRLFFKYLFLEGLVKDNPARGINIPKVVSKLPEIMTLEEIDLMVNSIDKLYIHHARDRAIIETLYGTGIRSAELIGLRFENLMFASGLIKVVGKGDRERLVPITPAAIRYMDEYLNGARSTIYKNHQDEHVFVHLDGTPLTGTDLKELIQKRAARAGIRRNITPHMFRHTFCTHMLKGGADLRTVQELMGHENIATTMIYTHLNVEDLRRTVNRCHPSAKAPTSPASPPQEFRYFHLAQGS